MMNDGSPEPDFLRDFSEDLCRIIGEMAIEFGTMPTVEELFEVIGWSIPLNDGHLKVPQKLPVKFAVTRRPGSPHAPQDASRVGSLNDAVFVDSVHMLATWASGRAAISGRAAALDELCSDILWALRVAAPQEFAGDFWNVAALGVSKSKRSRSASIGDIVAIPAEGAGYYLASILARNRFGTALGLYRGVTPRPSISFSNHPPVIPHPIYTDESLIASGVWQIIGHDDDLLSLFPKEPEIYHRSNPRRPDLRLGEFGAAENANGRLRQVDKAEAELVGLLDGSYRQVRPGEDLQRVAAMEFQR